MTDEEMAAKKATEKYPIPVCWNEIDLARNSCYEQGFLAGLVAGRAEWHDLRKNPDDLPKGEGLFAVYWSLGKIDGYTVINGFKNPHKDIVAWYEIPRFDEEVNKHEVH
jgi:hypothetical protein